MLRVRSEGALQSLQYSKNITSGFSPYFIISLLKLKKETCQKMRKLSHLLRSFPRNWFPAFSLVSTEAEYYTLQDGGEPRTKELEKIELIAEATTNGENLPSETRGWRENWQ